MDRYWVFLQIWVFLRWKHTIPMCHSKTLHTRATPLGSGLQKTTNFHTQSRHLLWMDIYTSGLRCLWSLVIHAPLGIPLHWDRSSTTIEWLSRQCPRQTRLQALGKSTKVQPWNQCVHRGMLKIHVLPYNNISDSHTQSNPFKFDNKKNGFH